MPTSAFFDEPDMIQIDQQTSSPGNIASSTQEAEETQETSALDIAGSNFT